MKSSSWIHPICHRLSVPNSGDRRLPDSPGAYVLLLELSRPDTVEVGALGPIEFPAATYAYVGSAMAGLSRRVRRYVRPVTRPRWHIDYLLPYAQSISLLTAESSERIECEIASALAGSLPSVPRFGSSDCPCASHLHIASNANAALTAASTAIRHAGAEPKRFRLSD